MREHGVAAAVLRPDRPQAGLAESAWARGCLYLWMLFPIVDFALRQRGIHPIGVIWDKLVLVILVVLALGRYVAGFRPRGFRWHRYAGWFLLFGLGLMFAGLAQPVIAVQGYRIDVYYILYTFLFPFVVSSRDVPRLLHIGAMGAMLVAVHAIVQYALPVPIPGGWVDAGEHVRTRVFSVLQSPNELGSFMALWTPLLLGMAIAERDRRRRWLYAIGTPLCLAAMLFTFTRGAWVALMAAVAVMAIRFEKRLLIGLVVIGVIGVFLPPIHHRIADLLSPVYWIKSSESGRIFKWITAYDQMTTNPLFGVGLGHFGGAVSSIYKGGIYSDNYYAKTLAETGLVGLTLFLAMHLALMRDLFQGPLRSLPGRDRYVAIGGVTGLVAVLVHNVMENVFEFAPMAVTYFTIATLLLIWGRGGQKEVPHDADAR
ncbi:O-antigen ligase family protein [Alicyclobacillus sp.]|uniref:O-antigen ligase family protein n=1 Tax=Alicyclobacillus sp. TaxID=61169 RepID=UPI0025C40CC4|nr:O-antigen ligase family protein [Alicyclobacillus sp.]MCL6515664.1 O-antigen ligase family protein [Alicyclobacillus sp.]